MTISSKKISSKEAYRSAMALCLAAQEASALISSGNLVLITAIRHKARGWLEQTETAVPKLSPGEALEIVSARDFIHRLAFNAPPLPGSADRIILKAFEAKVKGDAGVDQFLLFRQITEGIRRKEKAFLGRPFQWQSVMLAKWYKEFKADLEKEKTNPSDKTIESPAPNNSDNSDQIVKINKLSILLESDLWDFEPKDSDLFKRKLLEANRHLLLLEPEGIKQLKAIEHLLFRSLPYLSEEEYNSHKTRIEAAIRKELAPSISSLNLSHPRPAKCRPA